MGAFSGCDQSFRHQFVQPWNQTCQKVYKIMTRITYGSLLGNAAHMAAFMSKEGPMERGIHCATCQKDSTASDNLDMITDQASLEKMSDPRQPTYHLPGLASTSC